jgi:hypothetical protein
MRQAARHAVFDQPRDARFGGDSHQVGVLLAGPDDTDPFGFKMGNVRSVPGFPNIIEEGFDQTVQDAAQNWDKELARWGWG